MDIGGDNGGGRFLTTHWSQVLLAGDGSAPGAREALESLCAAYWYPLYAYLRRAGHSTPDASDLVQGFFADFLSRESLARVEEGRGRFRSYLLGALRHHVSHERERAAALKRGGNRKQVSLDGLGRSELDRNAAEARYAREPATDETAESLYERRFAAALIAAALEHLRNEERVKGRAEELALLEPFLEGDPPEGGYAMLAAQSGRAAGALRVAVHRLRRRWRQALVAEVARQVDRPQDVEDELRALFRALGGGGERFGKPGL